MDQLKHCLGDLLLAATISHVSTVPWLLESLGEQLGNLCRRFEPLVPDGLYLPAPPVYCPQPATVDKVRRHSKYLCFKKKNLFCRNFAIVTDESEVFRSIVALRYNAGLSIESIWVRIPFAAVSKVGHFRSLHNAPVHSA